MPRKHRDIASQVFAITNFNEDLEMDCNNAADAEIADVLATLIQELNRKGIIEATIA